MTCGTRQDVALYSKPAGAQVIVYNNHGEIAFQSTTPCVARLARTAPESERANYIVLMKKEGYQDIQIPLKSRLNQAGFASAFVGSLIVDADIGGAWTLCAETDHPELIVESPDILRPDGLCTVLSESPASPVTAKAQTASR